MHSPCFLADHFIFFSHLKLLIPLSHPFFQLMTPLSVHKMINKIEILQIPTSFIYPSASMPTYLACSLTVDKLLSRANSSTCLSDAVPNLLVPEHGSSYSYSVSYASLISCSLPWHFHEHVFLFFFSFLKRQNLNFFLSSYFPILCSPLHSKRPQKSI